MVTSSSRSCCCWHRRNRRAMQLCKWSPRSMLLTPTPHPAYAVLWEASPLSHGAACAAYGAAPQPGICALDACVHIATQLCAAMTSSTPRSQQPCSKAGQSRWPENRAGANSCKHQGPQPGRQAGRAWISRQGVCARKHTAVSPTTHCVQPAPWPHSTHSSLFTHSSKAAGSIPSGGCPPKKLGLLVQPPQPTYPKGVQHTPTHSTKPGLPLC